jgi:hypothetical protein
MRALDPAAELERFAEIHQAQAIAAAARAAEPEPEAEAEP